jgi:chromosome partitioning protein
VDLDEQANVAASLGLPPSMALRQVLEKQIALADAIVYARERLDVLLGEKESTKAAKRSVDSAQFRERYLRNIFLHCRHDVVIFDCAPSGDILQIGAIFASDYMLVPTKLDYLALKGVQAVCNEMIGIRQADDNVRVTLGGIIPTMFDRVTKETSYQLNELTKHFTDHVWPIIPTDARVRESQSYGKTLWEYAPHTQAMDGYEIDGKRVGGYRIVMRLVKELLGV